MPMIFHGKEEKSGRINIEAPVKQTGYKHKVF